MVKGLACPLSFLLKVQNITFAAMSSGELFWFLNMVICIEVRNHLITRFGDDMSAGVRLILYSGTARRNLEAAKILVDHRLN